MKKDIGFWDINGNYIEDIQELNEIERKEIMETKNFNQFFEELNDMANFKNFGETIKDKEFIDNPVIAYEELQQENAELKAENERLKEENWNFEEIVKLCRCEQYMQTLQEIKAIVEPFAKCYTHTCGNCKKYDGSHACCSKDVNCYKYNNGSKSACKDFVLPTKQFYEQIFANIGHLITKAEEE